MVTQGSLVWFVETTISTIANVSFKNLISTIGQSVAAVTSILALYMFMK